jgi:hypothetical protein
MASMLAHFLFPDRFGFFDKHDGNIIPDFIHQPALVADKAILSFVQINLTLAFGTCQNFQQIIADNHGTSL